MPALPPDDLVTQLRWRYAVQKFDPARKIDDQTWHALEQALVLCPSGFGLQPWQFLVITDPQIKADLVACSYGQPQVNDCSHVIVFAIRQQIDAEHVDRHIDRVAEVRAQERGTLERYRNSTVGYFEKLTTDAQTEWAARQVYLALGSFMTAASMLGIDTCPMEGIDPAKYDARLALADQGCRTIVVAAAGYRHPDDKYARLPKVRFDPGEVIQRL
jgi:nitroreductase